MRSKKFKIIALIPARSGSKSIKNKNLSLINGKPLIYYAIKSAIKSKYVNQVIVSTDSKQIKMVAKKFGADVPFMRPKNLSNDKVLDFPVIWDAVKQLKLNFPKYKKYIIVYLRPTQPLRTFKDIDKIIKFMINNKNIGCVRSIRKAIYPPFWMKKLVNKKILKPLIDNRYFKKTSRRQDLPIAHMCDGYVDAIKIGNLIKEKKFPPIKTYGVLSDTKYFVDIDEKKDLNIAELLMRKKWKKFL